MRSLEGSEPRSRSCSVHCRCKAACRPVTRCMILRLQERAAGKRFDMMYNEIVIAAQDVLLWLLFMQRHSFFVAAGSEAVFEACCMGR
jgi:hypothetical protein